MPDLITSTKNPIVSRFRDAAVGKAGNVLLAEGLRLVEEALSAGRRVLEIAIASRVQEPALRTRLQASGTKIFDCSDAVLDRLSQLETAPGIAALVERPEWQDEDLLRGDLAPLVVVAAGVRDPGNLGSVVRAAEAAGASGLLTLRGGADPFRDKAVRGSMGSVLRLPVRHGLEVGALLGFARDHRLRVVVADGRDVKDPAHTTVDFALPTMLVVGAEASGVPAELRAAAHDRVRIPLQAPVESLNVAVATGVLLFEARRQRG